MAFSVRKAVADLGRIGLVRGLVAAARRGVEGLGTMLSPASLQYGYTVGEDSRNVQRVKMRVDARGRG